MPVLSDQCYYCTGNPSKECLLPAHLEILPNSLDDAVCKAKQLKCLTPKELEQRASKRKEKREAKHKKQSTDSEEVEEKETKGEKDN